MLWILKHLPGLNFNCVLSWAIEVTSLDDLDELEIFKTTQPALSTNLSSISIIELDWTLTITNRYKIFGLLTALFKTNDVNWRVNSIMHNKDR